MASNNGDLDLMGHDPLADVDALPSSADDILDNAPLEAKQEAVEPEPVLAAEITSVLEAAADPAKPVIEEPVRAEEPISDEPVVEQVVSAVEEPEMTDSSKSTIDLGESLTIRDVAEVYEQLVTESTATVDGFVLSAGELQQVDGAGLQMLTAFVREVEGRGATLSWSAASDPLTEGAVHMGLTDALRLP